MTDNQIYALSKLESLITFLYQEIDRLTLPGQIRRKKKVFLPLYIGCCDLAGSVHLLLSKEKINSAESLLRNLQEAWLNTWFIFIDGNSTWVDSYLSESELELKKWAKKVRQLRERYPGADTGQASFSEQKLSEIEENSRKFLYDVKHSHANLPVIPGVDTVDITRKPYSLRDKTIIIDYLISQRSPASITHSFEWQYLLIYKYFSGITHIDARYLNAMYVQYDRQGISISKHGQLNDVEMIAVTTYAYLLDMAVIFGRQFGLPNAGSLKQYTNTLKELQQRIS